MNIKRSRDTACRGCRRYRNKCGMTEKIDCHAEQNGTRNDEKTSIVMQRQKLLYNYKKNKRINNKITINNEKTTTNIRTKYRIIRI